MKRKEHVLMVVIVLLVAFIVYNRYEIPLEIKKEKVWVRIELQQELVRDTTDYYYMGQINKDILDKIDVQRSPQGLFKLSNIRYWNNEDLLQIHENENSFDCRYFKIEDIQFIKPLKKDPVFIYEPDELHASAKKLRGGI
ncbi:hypothetical protein E9993_17285 [Labilibacter sediminis]|nr:hypothetical protein E9993_17285 [Labilibacter sediminis]